MAEKISFSSLFQSYSAMEAMRQNASLAMGINPNDVQMPYDLLSLTTLTTLWNEIGHDIGAMFETGVTIDRMLLCCM